MLPFKQVDVFTSKPFYGNPVAVILDAQGLNTETMQRIACWTNLSETAFVLPATNREADYRVRIFTPNSELAFAGHPTLGTAHALLEAGVLCADKSPLIQECGAGLLPLRVVGTGVERQIFVCAPQAQVGESDVLLTHSLAMALGFSLRSDPAPRLIRAGIAWIVVDLETAQNVHMLKPTLSAVAELTREQGAVGVCVFGRERVGNTALAVRAFCPGDGIPEDPVTGSANVCIAAYLYAISALERIGYHYRVSQGREVGRDGYVEVHVDAETGDIEIGGCAITCVEGTLR